MSSSRPASVCIPHPTAKDLVWTTGWLDESVGRSRTKLIEQVGVWQGFALKPAAAVSQPGRSQAKHTAILYISWENSIPYAA